MVVKAVDPSLSRRASDFFRYARLPKAHGAINYWDFGSNSIYGAGQITLRRRARGGIFYRVSYSYSKSIDTNSQFTGASDGGFGCLNVLGISAGHHNIGLFVVEGLPDGHFQLGHGGLETRREFFSEPCQGWSQTVQCGECVA